MHRATAHTRRARPQALASIARALGPAGRGAQLPPSGHARPAGSRSVAGRGVAASVHPLQGPSAGQTLLGLQLLRGQLRPLLLHQHAGRGLGRGGAGRPAGALPALPGLLVVVAVVVQPDAVLLQGQQVVLFGLDGEAYGSERRCWEKGDGDGFQGAEPPPLDPRTGRRRRASVCRRPSSALGTAASAHAASPRRGAHKNPKSPFPSQQRPSFVCQTHASCWARPLPPTPARPLQAAPHLVMRPPGLRVTSGRALPGDLGPRPRVAALSLGLPLNATPASSAAPRSRRGRRLLPVGPTTRASNVPASALVSVSAAATSVRPSVLVELKLLPQT